MTRNSIIKLTLCSFLLLLVLISLSYADEDPPVACFTASVDSGNIPFEVVFTDCSTGEITSWEWDFDDFTDISTVQNPTHTFDMSGDFNVTLTVTDIYELTSTATLQIDADVDLIAGFTSEITPNTFPVDVYFNDTSDGDIVAWEWDFDNDDTVDSTEQYPKYTYTAAGIYSVSLTVTDYYDKIETHTDQVVIESQPPVAEFSSSVVAGNAPLEVQFTSESTGDISTWEWDFDNDGTVDSTDVNPIYAFYTTGFYNVRHKVTGTLGTDEIIKNEYISVYSGTIDVICGETTIQDAINQASNGYRILVHDETYTGAGNKDIDFGGKAIHVVSENGPKNTTIDLQNSGRGFYFHSNEDSSSVLEGFTIQNGNEAADSGGGIKIVGASPTVKKCFVKNCTANNGGGIIIDNSSSPLFEFCLIENNSSTLDGSGVYIKDNSDTILRNCIVKTNTATRNGSIFISNQSDVSLQGLLIVQNSATGAGGGIYCDFSNPTCYNCTIADNTSASNGGGFYLNNQSTIVMNNTILWSNDAGTSCFGNQIYFNDAGSNVNAFYCCYDSNSNDLNNIIGAGSFAPDTNSITSDPKFTNPTNIDYQIVYDIMNPSITSPCIDSGHQTLVPTELKQDLYNHNRISDNDLDGNNYPNMGAHEDYGCHSIKVELTSSLVIDPKLWNLDPDDAKFIFKYTIETSTLSSCNPSLDNITIGRNTDPNPGIIASSGNGNIDVDSSNNVITWNCKEDNSGGLANPGEYCIIVNTICANPVVIFDRLDGFYIVRLGVWGIEGGHIDKEDESYFYNAANWMPLFYWNKDNGTQGPYHYTLFQLTDKGSTLRFIGSGDDSHGNPAAIPEPDEGFDTINLDDWKDKHNLPIVYKCAETGSTPEDKYSIELRIKLVDKCRSQENTLHKRILVHEVFPKDIKMKIIGDLTILCGKGEGTKVDIKDINYTLNNIVKLKPLKLRFPKLPFAYYKLGLKYEWSYKDTPIPGYQETAHTIYLLPYDSSSDFNWDFSYLRASELSSDKCRPADWDKRDDTRRKKSHQNVPWARVLHDVCRWSKEKGIAITNKNKAYETVIKGFVAELDKKLTKKGTFTNPVTKLSETRVWKLSKLYNPQPFFTYKSGAQFDKIDQLYLKRFYRVDQYLPNKIKYNCRDCAAITSAYLHMIGCKEIHPFRMSQFPAQNMNVTPPVNPNKWTNHWAVTPTKLSDIPIKYDSSIHGSPFENPTNANRRNVYIVLDSFYPNNSPIGLHNYNNMINNDNNFGDYEVFGSPENDNSNTIYYQDVIKNILINLNSR